MKIKMNTEFISFNDGVCDIYTIPDSGDNIYKYRALGFSNRVLGFKRYFEAAANQMEIAKVIRIPQLNNIDTYDHVIINDINYDVKLVQNIYDTNPPSIDLTLQ